MAKQVFIVAAILGSAIGARLDNLYLPANQKSFSSGGSYSGQYSSNPNNQIPILRLDTDNNGEGTYSYAYETGHGISAQEQGDARGDGTKAHGSYSYTAPGGERVSITYTADENGYQPQGSHIPTPPPIPEAILKSLQQNAAEEARGVFDDGQYRGEGLDDGQYRAQGYSTKGASSGGHFGKSGSSGFGGYKY
ncbi:endocuticle structural glycoprotein SgAbd-2-like [Cylas formicarius]|uniref:endocuticle structural glycoprotein SgAbd-2-like n=1 Tax=Cylas formicarius TaxID=197179 RepID=UPI0029589B81|nr:endocuticle structural glycoprotein SgAbd-2-like [Cylas formicarius]